MKRIAVIVWLGGMLMMLTSCKLNLGDTGIDLPWWVLTIMVVIPSLLIAVSVIWITVSENAKAIYVCPHCQHRFKPGWRVLYSTHVDDDYVLKCPHCGKRDFCHMSYDQEE